MASAASFPQLLDVEQALATPPAPAAAGRGPGTPQAPAPGSRPQSAVAFGKCYAPDTPPAGQHAPASPLGERSPQLGDRQRPLSAAAARARGVSTPAAAHRGDPAASPAPSRPPLSSAAAGSRPPSQLGRGGGPRASPRVLLSPAAGLYGALSPAPGSAAAGAATPGGRGGADRPPDLRQGSLRESSVLGPAAGDLASGQPPARQLQRYADPPSPPVGSGARHSICSRFVFLHLLVGTLREESLPHPPPPAASPRRRRAANAAAASRPRRNP